MNRVVALLLLATMVACSDLPRAVTGPPVSGPASEAPAAPPSSGLQQVPLFQPGVVVVRFRGGADAPAIAAAHGGEIERELRLGMKILRVPEGQESIVVQALSSNPNVELAELSLPRTTGVACGVQDGDCSVPDDAFFGRRWDLHNDGVIRDGSGNVLETVGPMPDADMDWLEAFDQLGQFTGDVVVGLVDTGIYPGHADLAGRLIAQHDFFDIDDVAEDDIGHGTHVAGIALALGANAMGATGIAYGPNARLVVAKGCGFAFFLGYICWSPDIADGIAWAVDQGAHVINLSLGGQEDSGFEQSALQYALAHDVLPVCAAGNDAAAVDYPAALPECMAVSSTDWEDTRSTFSSAGPEVEVSAPGGDTLHASGYDMIVSTWNDGGYAYAAGTSMAAPQVTGLAALLHALGVTSAADKRALLRSTADDLGQPGYDWLYGDGRINVWSAVQEALGGEPPPANQPPTSAFDADCTDLACDFTDASSDGDGSVVAWEWDFGDGAGSASRNPSHEYVADGTYLVTLTVTDDDGAPGVSQQELVVSSAPPPDAINLSAEGFKEKGKRVVRLIWGGATSPLIDVHRDGVRVATVSNAIPTYLDRPGGRGKAIFVYRVCEGGTSTCSNEAVVVF